MSIQAVIGFDHLEGVPTPWIYFDHNLLFTPASSGGTATVSGGWLGGNSTAGTYESLRVPLGQYCAAPVGEITIGFRINLAVYASATTNYLVDLAAVVTFLQSDIPGGVTGLSAYVEVSINLTTGVVRRWVDGNAIANGTSLTAAQLTAAKGGSLEMRLYTKASAAAAKFRDIYISDDQTSLNGETNLPVGRLGSHVVLPVTLDSVNAVNWTATSGSVLSALNATAGEAPATNVATSPATGEVLTASLKVTVPGGAAVKAIDLNVGGKSVASGPTTSSVKVKNGVNEKAMKAVLFPTAQTYNGALGILHYAPDGTVWNNSNIDATDLIITPDTGA